MPVRIEHQKPAAIAASTAVRRVSPQIEFAALLIAITVGSALRLVAVHRAAYAACTVRELTRLAASAAVLQRVERGLAAVLRVVIAVRKAGRATAEYALALRAARARVR
jgi:hypothetical protein